ncbi:S1C family serine protease [Eremococcus coleocola]|uniref:S1C family serine protease n=1 Tax=Eremococcus coleocola TaxID=88132 RepID=UPI00040D8DAD|nr:trypsin-like peptidase domain-containing protein [Eremococcus coleocola]
MTMNYNKQKQKTSYWRGIFSGLVGALVLGLTFLLIGYGFNYRVQPVHSQEQPLSSTDFENTITSVVDKTRDAVVTVSNYQNQQNLQNVLPFPYNQFQNQEDSQGQEQGQDGGIDLDKFDSQQVLTATGSGVVYKVDGKTAYIVTNHHVIDGADSVEVTMANGDTLEAKIVGSDSLSDLAVLSIDASKVTQTIEFAKSEDVKVGNIAIAIGSPIGSEYASSVTQGIVSGLDRQEQVDSDGDGNPDWEMTVLQTDAAINPGNSGGALVNSQGKLIGINSSKLADETIEGMGFAIPADDVAKIAQELEENGQIVRPQLGVSMYDLSAISLNSRQEVLKLDENTTDGAIVVEVVAGSAAEEAGLQQYDVITKVNDTDITDSQSLKKALYDYKVGDTITVTYLREGKQATAQVTLKAPNNQTNTMQGSQN